MSSLYDLYLGTLEVPILSSENWFVCTIKQIFSLQFTLLYSRFKTRLRKQKVHNTTVTCTDQTEFHRRLITMNAFFTRNVVLATVQSKTGRNFLIG